MRDEGRYIHVYIAREGEGWSGGGREGGREGGRKRRGERGMYLTTS